MKTPKKKEVVKYFENAKEIESEMGAKVVIDKDTFKFLKQVKGLCSNWIHNGEYVFWSSDFGYAKILSYKEPKEKKPFEYFKSDILEAIEKAALNKEPFYVHGIKYVPEYEDDMLKEAFPEVFETKLVEFNKWVVTPDYPKWIVKYDKDNDSFYGLNINGDWFHAELENRTPNQISNVREATEQEVTEALTKEAVKMGFKEGVYFKTPENGYSGICSDSFIYNSEFNILYCGSNAVFNKGKWAEIIQTITKAEAEQKLNCKIV